jgi:hypothetical protein
MEGLRGEMQDKKPADDDSDAGFTQDRVGPLVPLVPITVTVVQTLEPDPRNQVRADSTASVVQIQAKMASNAYPASASSYHF